MIDWLNGDELEKIVSKYGIYSGNIYKGIMKIANMIEEVINACTFLEYFEIVDKMKEIKSSLIHGIIISESLYL